MDIRNGRSATYQGLPYRSRGHMRGRVRSRCAHQSLADAVAQGGPNPRWRVSVVEWLLGELRQDHALTTTRSPNISTSTATCTRHVPGHPADLAKEAMDIADKAQWDEIVKGWTSKAWVSSEDDNLPLDLLNTVSHPDGLWYQRGDWSYGMRPREGAPILPRPRQVTAHRARRCDPQ